MTPEQTLDWLAEQHKSQCNEDRPVQEWIRSMKSMLPAPVQEPVADVYMAGNVQTNIGTNGRVVYVSTVYSEKPLVKGDKLYTTPPAAQRQWVGLTDEEIIKAMPGGIYDCLNDPWDCGVGDGDTLRSIKKDVLRIARAIEAKLKEKNNG